MRTVLLLIVTVTGYCAESTSGTWKVNATRSGSTGGTQLRIVAVRIDRHPRGEVFTLDKIEADGRTTSSSTILYFDGVPHDFQDFGCSGTQSSRRVDSRTIEIVRTCASGEWTRFVRRLGATPSELIVEVTGQQADGRRVERRLVLEKQSETGTGRNGPPENDSRRR